MNQLRFVYVAVLLIVLSGCSVTAPECSNTGVQSLVLKAAEATMRNRLLAEKASSPGFQTMVELGEAAEDTPSEIAAQISSGEFDYSSWNKYRRTHEWIAVVVQYVDVDWEKEFSNGEKSRLDSIRTEHVDGANSKSTCSAEWHGVNDKMPITYTAKKLDNNDNFQVEIVKL